MTTVNKLERMHTIFEVVNACKTLSEIRFLVLSYTSADWYAKWKMKGFCRPTLAFSRI